MFRAKKKDNYEYKVHNMYSVSRDFRSQNQAEIKRLSKSEIKKINKQNTLSIVETKVLEIADEVNEQIKKTSRVKLAWRRFVGVMNHQIKFGSLNIANATSGETIQVSGGGFSETHIDEEVRPSPSSRYKNWQEHREQIKHDKKEARAEKKAMKNKLPKSSYKKRSLTQRSQLLLGKVLLKYGKYKDNRYTAKAVKRNEKFSKKEQRKAQKAEKLITKQTTKEQAKLDKKKAEAKAKRLKKKQSLEKLNAKKLKAEQKANVKTEKLKTRQLQRKQKQDKKAASEELKLAKKNQRELTQKNKAKKTEVTTKKPKLAFAAVTKATTAIKPSVKPANVGKTIHSFGKSFTSVKASSVKYFYSAIILVSVLASQISIYYSDQVGVYVTAAAIVVLAGLAIARPEVRQLAISVAVLPVVNLFMLCAPQDSVLIRTASYYGLLLVLTYVYRYLFSIDNPINRTSMKGFVLYLIFIPVMLVVGQIFGVLQYVSMHEFYPFFGTPVVLVSLMFIVFAFTEEAYFRGLIQSSAIEETDLRIAFALSTVIYGFSFLNAFSLWAVLIGLMFGAFASLAYSIRQNVLLTAIANATSKVLFIGLIVTFG